MTSAMTREGSPRPEDVDRVVGGRIRAIRKARGVSMEALAASVGVSWQQIQKYERGLNRVSVGRAVLIATLLGSSVEDLVYGGNTISPATGRQRSGKGGARPARDGVFSHPAGLP